MPIIKSEKVISFSSEDPIHVADHILSSDPSKKWKCRATGEKSSNVVVQLEQASVISSIDIGNENSAYVECLVNRSSLNDDFKLLLVMSSFMTPMEARQGTNGNKVRMFTKEQLSKPECDEKWDRVKIVCTQPFNRHMQYGLSFVTFHSPGEKESSSSVPPPNANRFVVRPDSPDNFQVGSLFARRKELQENAPLKAAAAIREASSKASESQTKLPSNQKKFKFYANYSSEDESKIDAPAIKDRNRNQLLYAKDEEEPNKKIDLLIEQKAKETKRKEEKAETEAKKKLDRTKTKARDEPSTSKTTESSKRKLNTTNASPTSKRPKPAGKICKPFGKLLDGVVLVISGIQNPDRADLRAKAMSMGAKYKSDWDNTCTHLICAFSNTPKYNQVKGKGKIVTKNWINDCESKRKKLPWRRYALDKREKQKDESEEEIFEEIIAASASKDKSDDCSETSTTTTFQPSTTAPVGSGTENGVSRKTFEDDTNVNDGDTDTEDEIERIRNHAGTTTTQNIFNVDTEEEDEAVASMVGTGQNGIPSLSDSFADIVFYIDPNLSEKVKALLVKYIAACDGETKVNLDASINVVISSDEQKSALKVPSDTDVVSPEFVWECYNCEMLLPIANFKL